MLKEDFYKISNLEISEDELSVKAVIELNREHEIFKGHFPEIPVVPAVCSIQIIKEILADVLKKNIMLVKGNNIKLHNPINPDLNLLLNIDLLLKTEADLVPVNAEVYFEKIKFCSFRGDFKIL